MQKSFPLALLELSEEFWPWIKFFFDIVPSFSADEATTGVSWMFSWRIKCEAAWALYVSKISLTWLVFSKSPFNFRNQEWPKNSLRGITLRIRRIWKVAILPISCCYFTFMGGAVASWFGHSSPRSIGTGFEPWSETLPCVFGQDTLLSQCLAAPRCINWYRRTLWWTSIPSRGK